MKKNPTNLLSILTASALSLGLLASCSQPSEPTAETTPTPFPTISQEPVEETPTPQQPDFDLPAYLMAILSDMAVVSDSEFGLDGMRSMCPRSTMPTPGPGKRLSLSLGSSSYDGFDGGGPV